MADRHTFGPRLAAARERRGISIDTLAAVTNVSRELWEGLERNDFSRWPSGLFARSFVRDYARAIGLDEHEVIDEFCRLFAVGDRRTRRILEAHARIVGHQPEGPLDVGELPPEGDRRAPMERPTQPPPGAAPLLSTPRTLATLIDISSVGLLAAAASLVSETGFYATVGVVAILYYGVATIALGASAGTRAVAVLRQRIPSLFSGATRHRAPA